jgi:hypothetical protein
MALFTKPFGKFILQQVSGMVGGEGNAHPGELGDAAKIRQ